MLQSFMKYLKNPTMFFQLFFIHPRLLGLHFSVQYHNGHIKYFWENAYIGKIILNTLNDERENVNLMSKIHLKSNFKKSPAQVQGMPND